MDTPVKNIWSSTIRLLVVFTYTDESEFKVYRKALDNLLNDSNVRELKIIVLIPGSVKKETLQQHKLIHYFSPKDVSFMGKLKDESLISTLAQPYDSLLWLNVNDDKLLKVTSKLNCTWKIGVNTTLNNFAIQVFCQSQNPIEIVNFAKNTLEKITSYE